MNTSADPAADRAQEDRILALFATGHTLDDITRIGAHEWTRARVQHVAHLHGLTLNAAGQWMHRPQHQPTRPTIPQQRRHTDHQETRR